MKRTRFMLLAALALLACSKKQDTVPAPAASVDLSEEHEPQRPLLKAGEPVPELTAVAHDGTQVKLREMKGKPLVVYFYPKDDTPGCTVEAQELRDEWEAVEKTGAVVLGVSTDDNESHVAFARKHKLPFYLIPDTTKQFVRAFGVPLNNGRAARVTFIIDGAGKVAKVFPKVNPKGSAKQVLAELQKLQGGVDAGGAGDSG